MKISLALIGKILGIVVVLLVLVTFGLYLYVCRTIDVPTSKHNTPTAGSYQIVDTAQNSYWDNSVEVTIPKEGEAFYGQDAQYTINAPSYKDNSDGTITDNVPGLMWTQTPDLNADGIIDANDKLTLSKAASSVSEVKIGGYKDWRLPTIKELYSLINFNGIDGKIYDSTGAKPFIDTNYFKFGYGDTSAGERNIDAQFATQTVYVDKTFIGFQTMFGVNFADGRIKGYPTTINMSGISEGKCYIFYVRGNTSYGVNDFIDNGDKTISDNATQLMWSKEDSGTGMDWEQALKWVQTKNAENYLGHSDWRLPNIKELQSIVDYSKSPATTKSPAIDSIFNTTKIKNESGADDYGYFWSSTTHMSVGKNINEQNDGSQAAYLSFGRSMGKMFGFWMDVHGAGSQRSEFKSGNSSDYPDGFGPQGDAIRINNFVRLVRTIQK
ncbi:MAG: DUF1566 domain-containing protein [Clostridia bacterium]